MGEENGAADTGFATREGGPAFGGESNAEETASVSQAGEENQEGETHSQQGEKENTAGDDKDIPFHEHPRWKQREDEWNERFNDQEKRHQDDLKAIREEFSTARQDNKENTKIPAWFGGTQEQWDAYRKDRDDELKAAEDRAITRYKSETKSEAESGEKAVKEATEFMRSELSAIEADKTLNPTGGKIDEATAKKLLQTVLDNELIDSKGRWNYRAGWKLMNSHARTSHAPNTKEKKEVAASTTSEARAETKAPTVKTSADFKKKRPW